MSGRCRGRGRGNARRRTVRNSPERDEGDEFDAYEDPLDIGITVKNEVICPEMFQTEDEVFGMVDSQNLVEEQQRMQQAYHLEAGSTDYHISQRLSSLERKMDFLLNINTRILARVDKICENMRTVTKPTDFPVKTKEGLETVDVKIANNMDKYIELFKSLLKPSGIIKNIGRILDQKLLMEMNYAGCSSKTGLSNYVNLNTALYESLRTEGYSFDDYKKDVRMAFAKAKNRVYKAKFEANRLKKLFEDNDDSSNDKEAQNNSNLNVEIIDNSHLSKIAVKCREKMKTLIKSNDFPVKTAEELEALDVKVANNMEQYIDLFKNVLMPSGIVKHIIRVIDVTLVMEMNYGGFGSKTGLSSYTNLDNALYRSQKTEGYSFDDYKKDVRLAFQRAKNRVYKAKHEANRLKKLKANNYGSKKEF
ncbi:GH14573 [Drosophila grimshawi]|uniref:GH14573 n=1 Tax=Drosophila grimshawi TaxID=7222 RepID=B4IYJ2_DROGR|nr:GH14573 [Drosophila grimshawi]